MLKFDATTLNFFVLSRYIIRAPLGSEGWIIGVHSLEGVIGGHSWLGLFLISGGFWHVATQPFDALMRAFTWSGEAILGDALSTLSLFSSRFEQVSHDRGDNTNDVASLNEGDNTKTACST